MSDTLGKLDRWPIRLSEFGFKVVYRSGLKHELANAVSSLQTRDGDEIKRDNEIPVLTISSVILYIDVSTDKEALTEKGGADIEI